MQHNTGVLGRGAIWSVLNGVAGQSLSLIVFLVTARFVSKEAFGIMAVSILCVEAFRQIVIGGFGTALVAQNNPSAKYYNACFFTIFFSGVVAAAFTFLFSGPISRILGYDEIAVVLQYISLILLTAGLSQTHETWLAKNMRFRTLALRSILSILAGGAVGIYMAVNGYGLYALIAQQVVMAVTAFVFIWTATEWRPGLSVEKADVKSLFHYAKYLFGSRSIWFASSQADTFFASYYLGAAATGVYSAAKRITLATTMMFSAALGGVSLPAFANRSHDKDSLARGFLKASSLTSLVTAPAYLGLFVLADDIILILLGEKWIDAAPVLQALVLTAYLTSIAQYQNHVLLVSGKPKWEMLFNAGNALVNIILFIWLARYGLVMLALAFGLRALIFFPVGLGLSLRLLDMRLWPYVRDLAPPVLMAVAMAVSVWSAKTYLLDDVDIYLRTIILVPAGAVIYIGLIYFLNRRLFSDVLLIVKKIAGK